MPSPFALALGPALGSARSALRDHLIQDEGTRSYRGVMHRIARLGGFAGLIAAPALRIAGWSRMLFVHSGADLPFEMELEARPWAGGSTAIRALRTCDVAGRRSYCQATIAFDTSRGTLVETLGAGIRLEVELRATVRRGALRLRSGRQRLRLGPLVIPIPRLLTGHATVRQWERPDGRLGISVAIRNALLGTCLAYVGSFAPVGAACVAVAGGGRGTEEVRRWRS